MKEDGNLRVALDPVHHEVERAKISKEEIEKDVRKWLTDVSSVIEVVKKLEEEKQANKTCLSGHRPTVAWRCRLSREAEEIRSLMLKLLDGGKFTRVSHRANSPGIEFFFASRDFVTFESTKTNFGLVIEALKDDKINMVGIYGMGGVGKKVREFNIFNGVVLATVSQTPNLKSIQHHWLSLESKEESEDLRARRLFMRFKNEKKIIIIILDDVWAKITITGIPSVDDRKGCKILLTTRRKHVYVIMGCESQIPLTVLKGEEGLALLQKKWRDR